MTILCIATYFKGEPFLRECKALGCTVLLLTTDKLLDAEWPRESIDEIHSVPRDASDESIRRHVDKIARRHHIDRIASLDDFDVELGAMLREHLRVPGMGRTTASRFRDKLAMRMQARTLGIPVPEFSPVFNDQEVADWAARVPPPWVLKPRSSAAAIGIKKVGDRDALWRALDAAGDDRSRCVLEQFVPGDVYHVDSIVWAGKVVFDDRVQVRPSADGSVAPGRHLHHAPVAGRFRRGAGRARDEPHAAGRAGPAPRRVAHGVHPRGRERPGRVCVSGNLRAGRRCLHRRHHRGGDRHQSVAGVGKAGDRRRAWRVRRSAAPRRLRRDRADARAAGSARHVLRTPIRKSRPRYARTFTPASSSAHPIRSVSKRWSSDYAERFYRDFFATAPPPERPLE